MEESKNSLWQSVREHQSILLNKLSEKEILELASQENSQSRTFEVLGKTLNIIQFKEILPNGETIIVSQASTPAFLGLGWRSSEIGIVIGETGNIRQADESELEYVL